MGYVPIRINGLICSWNASSLLTESNEVLCHITLRSSTDIAKVSISRWYHRFSWHRSSFSWTKYRCSVFSNKIDLYDIRNFLIVNSLLIMVAERFQFTSSNWKHKNYITMAGCQYKEMILYDSFLLYKTAVTDHNIIYSWTFLVHRCHPTDIFTLISLTEISITKIGRSITKKCHCSI